MHDIWGHRIAEYDYDDVAGTSSLIREYLWAGDRLIGVYENGAYYPVRTDHIGRPIFATDMAGTIVWDATYLPFGGVQTSAGPNLDLRFPGQWFQAEAGLHQNWMRDCDPTLGRYLQADPLGLVDGASIYGYALQNPGRYVDPTGQYAQVLLCAGPQAAVCAGVAGATLLYIWWQHGDDVVDVCEQAIDDLFQPPYILNNDGGRVKTPNVGPPNSRHVNPNNGQIRDYGPDGRPIRDIDFNHDHGSGSPHGHDWGEDENGNPERGPARPIRPEDNIGDDS